MKTQERHHLKQNEFATTVARVTSTVAQNRDRVMMGLIAGLVGLALIGGYFLWQKRTNDRASAQFGIAMAILESPVAPAPTVPGATQAPGTFPTDQARQEAAVAAFKQVADAYPRAISGIAARYHSAGSLLALGRAAEAEKAYQEVIDRAGATSLYGANARMGQAESLAAQAQYDKAIAIYTELSGQRDGVLPIDGVLVQLARTCVKAGKTSEARAAFKRVVDEFPQSSFAGTARQEMTTIG